MPPEPEQREQEFRDYLSILARRWVTIAVTTVIVVAVVVGITYTEEPVYQSQAEIVLQAGAGGNGTNDVAARSIETEIKVFNSGEFRGKVAEKLEGNVPAISAAAAGLTDVIVITGPQWRRQDGGGRRQRRR